MVSASDHTASYASGGFRRYIRDGAGVRIQAVAAGAGPIRRIEPSRSLSRYFENPVNFDVSTMVHK